MSEQIFTKSYLRPFRRLLRKKQTLAESVLWKELRNRRMKYKFRRQHSIGNYITDFYCVEHKLAIEVDGATHDDPAQIKNDAERDAYMNSLGIRVLRFGNEEVLADPVSISLDIFRIIESDEKCTKK